MHNSLFDKDSKKLVFEKTHSKNKNFQGNWSSKLDLNEVPPSKIVQIHEVTSESIKMLVDEMENENANLKEKI